MGIDGDVPADIEAEYEVEDHERPELRRSPIQIEAEVEEDKKQGDMDKHTGKAIGGKTLSPRERPRKVFSILFYVRH